MHQNTSTEKSQPEFQRVELNVLDPHLDKSLMVSFNGESELTCVSYNLAIKTILQEEGMQIFHQIGTSPSGSNEPGQHAWEIWTPTTKDHLTALFERIHLEAAKTHDSIAPFYSTPDQRT